MGSEVEVGRKDKSKRRKYMIEDVVLKKRGKIEPLLVNFANGQPLEGSELYGALHYKTDKHKSDSTQNVLTIKTPYLGYASSHTDVQTPSGTTMFLGILNPDTGRMRLLETSQYTVQPVLNNIAVLNDHKPNSNDKTFAEKQEIIAAAFGSKKAKQAVSRWRQNQVESGTMSGAIDQAVSTAANQNPNLALEDYIMQKEESSLLTVLPPCNREATNIKEVYQLENLAPDNFLAMLQGEAKRLLCTEELEPSSTPLFREMVENARQEEKLENQIKLACVALFVKHLHVFLNCRTPMLRDFEKGRLMDNCCQGVASWIMQEYTVQQGNFISRLSKDEDRALCLSLILAFISSKYDLSVSTLLQSIPIKRERLDLIMKVIGAKYSNTNHSYLLKLPLFKYSELPKKQKQLKRK